MIEYKVVATNVNHAEEKMNELAQEGWQVIDTAILSGGGITTGSTPFVITFGRKI